MLNTLIRFSLNNRNIVILFGLLVTIYGLWTVTKLPVDVFPNLNRPTVAIISEAHGLAPEEVETLVTHPVESVLSGVPGVVRLRSSSGIGISIVHVEFDWGTDPLKNRQSVTERLQILEGRLPEDIKPQLGPISSIMGEIQFIGLVLADESVSPMDIRSLADWTIRPRLMTVPGISQVVVMGGDVKQYQILVSSAKLQKKGISLEDLKHAISEISDNTTGGFLDIDEKEYLIRPLGRVTSVEEIENSFISMHLGHPVLVKDVAEVKIAGKSKRGVASINGHPAVVMTIQKQPHASTIDLTNAIEREVKEIEKSLPKGIKIESDLFKQKHFIEASIKNVEQALRDGVLIVALIIFLFLLNLQTTAITLVAIPLSLLVTAIIFHLMGLGINTMTLGGLAIAIGELVDDAIVDVENIFRRLREHRMRGTNKNPIKIIFEASSEIRNSIVFSTIIIVLVFVPLFALGGMEGRLFTPLGISYIVSILASLLISLTITPVLCSFLLSRSKTLERERESLASRAFKLLASVVVKWSLDRPYLILGACILAFLFTISLVPRMGRNFLPKFNEGTATIGIAAPPGISLTASDALGTRIEEAMLSIPEVKSTVRRTGRAEMDEHAEGVHWSEIDVDFKNEGRSREVVLNELRERIENVDSNIGVNIGQPISHRLDHLLSGVRAQIAIKIFGNDLNDLRTIAGETLDVMQGVPGLVDIQTEPLVLIPQLKIGVDRENANKFGIRSGNFAKDLEIALYGETAFSLLEEQRIYDVFMRLDDESRSSPDKIKATVIKFMPDGKPVALGDVASVYKGTGPNMINREDMKRRIVVSANSSGQDLRSLVDELTRRLEEKVKLPEGYFIKIGGQFETEQESSRKILILAIFSILGILFVLFAHFRSLNLSLQVMLNIPLALVGGVFAVYLTERVLSVATLIAFITLCGIATRNGVMMLSHYLHLMSEEKEAFSKAMIVRGTLERLIPVLMTAYTAALALIPLALSKGQPGKEILYPVAVVIIGGLFSSTILNFVVLPPVFFRFGKVACEKYLAREQSKGGI